MRRTLYDAVDPSTIPPGATLVAGYVDGKHANLGPLRLRFPYATLVSIAVRYTSRAQVLDVGKGEATPAEAILWCTHTMTDKSNRELTVHCDAVAVPHLRAAFREARVDEPNYWIVRHDNDPRLPDGVIAKEYQSTSGWDKSIVADYWPGVNPAPDRRTP